MGTKIGYDNCLPGYYSMRDLTFDSNGGSWPAYNGFHNGQYYYGFLSRGISDSYAGYSKDLLKQTMLEHETIFKNQVYELHRLYRVQRDLMDEFKRKEGYNLQTPYETSSSSSPFPSQIPSEGASKWNASSIPLGNSILSNLHVPAPPTGRTFLNENNGKKVQDGPALYSSPKDSETSDSRPSKIRRKMIDLQLPADEYIDVDDAQHCGEANRHCDIDNKSASENGVKLLLSQHERDECNSNSIRSDTLPWKSNALADLNEPFLVEEPSSYPSLELSGTTMPRDGSTSVNFLGLPMEISQTSRNGTINGISDNLQLGSKGDGRGWFSHVLDAERSGDKLRSIHPPQLYKLLGSSQLVHFPLEPTEQAPGLHPSNVDKRDSWKTKANGERNYFHRGYSNSGSFLPSQGPAPSSFSHPLSLSHSVQLNPCMTTATLSKTSVPTNDLFLDKGLFNSNLRVDLDLGSEMSVRNGFYLGSSSGSNEVLAHFPPANIGSVDHGNDKRAVVPGGFFRTSLPHSDVNFKKDLNLSIVLSNGFSFNQNSQLPLKIMDRVPKLEVHHPAPPWLTGKGACSKEAASPGKALNTLEAFVQTPSELFGNGDMKRGLDRPDSPASTSSNVMRHETKDCLDSRMVLGAPVFEKHLVSNHEPTYSVCDPSHGLQPPQDEDFVMSDKKGGFDINMPYDPMDSEFDKTAADEVVLQKRMKVKGADLRSHIDLNSSASEDDDPLGKAKVKCVINIDLEAPLGPETEDDDLVVESSKMLQNPTSEVPRHSTEDVIVAELARAAAEAIIDISASVVRKNVEDLTLPPSEDSLENPLNWFTDIFFSCVDASVNHLAVDASRNCEVQEDCFSFDSGYFESMTLKLTECDVKEYLSKPSEVLNAEGKKATMSGSRPPRRGQARRGRQRRDFQRDILPGLLTLSRHEVTEDLQTFGGLMKATGHTWNSGPRRNATRNVGARGRRRSGTIAPIAPPVAKTVCALLKQQLSNDTSRQVQLEGRSLARRPCRQRFPTGNPAAVALT